MPPDRSNARRVTENVAGGVQRYHDGRRKAKSQWKSYAGQDEAPNHGGTEQPEGAGYPNAPKERSPTEPRRRTADSSKTRRQTDFPIWSGWASDGVRFTPYTLQDKSASLVIQINSANCSLPASDIDLDSIAEQFGNDVDPADITVNVSIAEPSDTIAQVVADAANMGGLTLVVPAVEFHCHLLLQWPKGHCHLVRFLRPAYSSHSGRRRPR